MTIENLPVLQEQADREIITFVEPKEVLERASRAAKAIQDIVSKNPKKVIIKGEQYLKFEDWQTIGEFYRVTPKIEWSRFIEVDGNKGYEAKANVVDSATGRIISSAEAMCLSNEGFWGQKSLNQMRSNAQTRAAAKALKMRLSHIAVMAGYSPTPAEEMDESDSSSAEEVTNVTFDMARFISGIKDMLAQMNGGDENLMNNQLKVLTEWTDKKTGQKKHIQLADLPGISNRKPEWIKGIHKKVSEEFTKAFNAKTTGTNVQK